MLRSLLIAGIVVAAAIGVVQQQRSHATTVAPPPPHRLIWHSQPRAVVPGVPLPGQSFGVAYPNH